MIKKIFIYSIILIIVAACQNLEKDNNISVEYETELAEHAGSYMSQLKSVLLSNMQEGGPLQAVSVCSDTAQLMSEEYSKKMDVFVKRSSFKNRNILNFPDNFESKAIKQFEEKLKTGNLTSETNIIEQSDVNGIKVVRYVKPILVEAPCLNCHGSKSQISKDVAEVIKQKYPKDKATGYKIGDLRGVISVTKQL